MCIKPATTISRSYKITVNNILIRFHELYFHVEIMNNKTHNYTNLSLDGLANSSVFTFLNTLLVDFVSSMAARFCCSFSLLTLALCSASSSSNFFLRPGTARLRDSAWVC